MVEFKDIVKIRRKELNLSLREIDDYIGVSISTIQRYETGEIINVRRDKIFKLSKILQPTPANLMGWEFSSDSMESVPMPNNLIKIPIITTINTGNHCTIEEKVTGYMHIDKISLGTSRGDYVAITIKGNSMLPVLKKGDTVVVLRQNECKDGEIALVIIDNKVTIKKIRKQGQKLVLQPINPEYELIFCDTMDCNIKIYGIPKIIQRRV